MMGLFDRHYQSYDEWCQTERGRETNEKFRIAAEENARKKAEWEANTPPEIKSQLRQFQVLFSVFFITFCIADFIGLTFYKYPFAIGGQFLIGLASFILCRTNPFKVKYPNNFFMPTLAFLISICFSVCLICVEFNYEFSRAVMVEPPVVNAEVLEKSEKDDKSLYFENEGKLSESEFYEREYSQFLKENNLVTEEELEESYQNYRYEKQYRENEYE